MNALSQLRIVAFLEGLSFIVLLFVAMPLKYWAGMPAAVRVVGSLHGILFLAFVVALFRVASEHDWPLKRSVLGFISSLLPFGTFVFDRTLKEELERTA